MIPDEDTVGLEAAWDDFQAANPKAKAWHKKRWAEDQREVPGARWVAQGSNETYCSLIEAYLRNRKYTTVTPT